MIHEIAVNLGEILAERGCPIPVIDGPEFRTTTTFARERIVVEHDPAGDSFGPRHRADTGPRTRLTRLTGVKITIYTQKTTKGAIYWEHVRRAEHALDLVLISIDIIAKIRQNLVVFKSGKFVYPEDLKESETPGGAVYELLLTFDRGVAERNWDGTGGPTAIITDVYPNSGTGVTLQSTVNATGIAGTETASGTGGT